MLRLFCHIIYAMLYILYSFSEKYNQKHNRQFKSGIPIFCMNILQLSCNYKVKLYPTLQSISKNIIFLFSLNKQKKIIINNNNIFNTKLLFIYNIYRSQKDILLLSILMTHDSILIYHSIFFLYIDTLISKKKCSTTL